MTIFQGWRIAEVPTNKREERFVATYQDRVLKAATMTTLRRMIEAALDEAYA